MNARQMKIFDIVQKKGEATVAHLAATLFVSQMTIRRDLVELEKNGMLTRYHGGAVAIDSNDREDVELLRRLVNVEVHLQI